MSDTCGMCIAKDAQIAQLGADLATARECARRFEVEAHALRREIQALRAECDTRRLARGTDEFRPHDAPTDTIHKSRRRRH